MFTVKNHRWHYLLLLAWIVLGIGLRLTNLELKSAASIEISSIGFSLGNGFENVPLNRVINLDTLLSPLQFSRSNTIKDVIHHLITESNHPPLFFILTHFWLKPFSPGTELDLLWLVRLESAIFGILSIPAIFILAWLSFRSLIVAQISAALISVSPYGIYLAQEARHYTLTLGWIIASLGCLVVALRWIEQSKKLPWPLVYFWIIVNVLGILTHDLFYLALVAEGMVVGIFWLQRFPQHNHSWGRMYAVISWTLIFCLVSLTLLKSGGSRELTEWIETRYDLGNIWQPVLRLLAWLVTMVFLLPVEGTTLPIILLSAVVLSLALLWVFPAIVRSWQNGYKIPNTRSSLASFTIFFLSTITSFLAIIYIWGKDLSQAARYQFVYFPSIIILLGFALSICWGESSGVSLIKAQGKKVILVILVLGLLGGLTVVNNYGYQKSQRADILAKHIIATSPIPVMIASAYYTHAELRSLIALGIELKSLQKRGSTSPKFFLIPRNKDKPANNLSSLENVLKSVDQPLDLWTLNLKLKEEDLEQIACYRESNQPDINGYRYRLYHCNVS